MTFFKMEQITQNHAISNSENRTTENNITVLNSLNSTQSSTNFNMITTTESPYIPKIWDKNEFILTTHNYFTYGADWKIDPDIENYIKKRDEAYIKDRKEDVILFGKNLFDHLTFILNRPILDRQLNKCYILSKKIIEKDTLIDFCEKTVGENYKRMIDTEQEKQFLTFEYNDTRFTPKNDEMNCFEGEHDYINSSITNKHCNSKKNNMCNIL